MLGRLGIRRRLTLLLAIPSSALLLATAPFVGQRVTQASAAGSVARAAGAARDVGGLIQDLQQERLLVVGYLATPQLDQSALRTQAETALDDAQRLRTDPGTAVVLRRAADPLAALSGVRARVVARTIDPGDAYRAYRDADTALLDALRLTDTPGADAAGQRQLEALDELMRANEDASGASAALVGRSGSAQLGPDLLTQALYGQDDHGQRFRRLVGPDQAALLDVVENGAAGQRVQQLEQNERHPSVAAPVTTVSDALSAVVSYVGLRRIAQDRIAREISTAASHRARVATLTAFGAGTAALALLLLVLVLAALVSRSIAAPLARLTRAAGDVADLAGAELVRVADSDDVDTVPADLPALDVTGPDELGSLAVAFNRVQSQSAALVGRQASARRNVAVMFANIARRTQNLVGRQLQLIDAVRTVAGPGAADSIARLDLLTSRLHRSADSLLVVAGTVQQDLAGEPMSLGELVRGALAEIEGFAAVRLTQIESIGVVAGIVADLRLLLAEVLENAVNFSPPAVPIEVSATVPSEVDGRPGGCRISVVDHGLGLGPERLAEENRRLVERERLDIMPTSMLGLFVVGRLARRHGLTVRLNQSPGGGVTVTMDIPAALLVPAPMPGRRSPGDADAMDGRPGSFDWFTLGTSPAAEGPGRADGRGRSRPNRPGRRPLSPSPSPATATAGAADEGEPPVELSRGGLPRRRPGARLAVDAIPAAVVVPESRDPEAERVAVAGWNAGTDPAIRAEIFADITAPDEAATAATQPIGNTAPRRLAAVPAVVAAVVAAPDVAVPAVSAAMPAVGMSAAPMPATPVRSAPPGSALVRTDAAAPSRPAEPASRNGLTRRVPGRNMGPSLRASAQSLVRVRGQAAVPDPSLTAATVPLAAPRPVAAPRDPEAERQSLNGFLAGFERGWTAALPEPTPYSISERR